MEDPNPQIEPDGTGLPRRYRRIQIIREALQGLIDKPYDEQGRRLTLRLEQQYRAAVKTAANDLKVQVRCESFDSKWMKVTIVMPGDPASNRGRPQNFRS